jgi:hypothetical protein
MPAALMRHIIVGTFLAAASPQLANAQLGVEFGGALRVPTRDLLRDAPLPVERFDVRHTAQRSLTGALTAARGAWRARLSYSAGRTALAYVSPASSTSQLANTRRVVTLGVERRLAPVGPRGALWLGALIGSQSWWMQESPRPVAGISSELAMHLGNVQPFLRGEILAWDPGRFFASTVSPLPGRTQVDVGLSVGVRAQVFR